MSLFGAACIPLCLPPVGKLLTALNIPVTLQLFYSQLFCGGTVLSGLSVLT